MAGAKSGVHVLQLKPISVPKSLQDVSLQQTALRPRTTEAHETGVASPACVPVPSERRHARSGFGGAHCCARPVAADTVH
ncbi:hypothetical protein MTO96_002235 [Rhipicephalus appendiculatus]